MTDTEWYYTGFFAVENTITCLDWWFERIKWCESHIGSLDKDWILHGQDSVAFQRFGFKTPEVLAQFVLTWG